MAKCKKCGYILNDSDKFCISCGTKQQILEIRKNDIIDNEIKKEFEEKIKKIEKRKEIKESNKINEYKNNKNIVHDKFNEKNFNNKSNNDINSKVNNIKVENPSKVVLFPIIIILLLIGLSIGCSNFNNNKESYVSKLSSDDTDSIRSTPSHTVEKDRNIENIEEQKGSGEYIIPHSSRKPLTRQELDKMTKRELQLARNEIFARHGYVFKEGSFKNYFNSKSWYAPNPKFTGEKKQLSSLERHNIKMILTREGLQDNVPPDYESDYDENYNN